MPELFLGLADVTGGFRFVGSGLGAQVAKLEASLWHSGRLARLVETVSQRTGRQRQSTRLWRD